MRKSLLLLSVLALVCLQVHASPSALQIFLLEAQTSGWDTAHAVPYAFVHVPGLEGSQTPGSGLFSWGVTPFQVVSSASFPATLTGVPSISEVPAELVGISRTLAYLGSTPEAWFGGPTPDFAAALAALVTDALGAGFTVPVPDLGLVRGLFQAGGGIPLAGVTESLVTYGNGIRMVAFSASVPISGTATFVGFGALGIIGLTTRRRRRQAS